MGRASTSLASRALGAMRDRPDAMRDRPVTGNNRWALSRQPEPHTDRWVRRAAATEPRRSQGPVVLHDPWAARFAAAVGIRRGEPVQLPPPSGPERFLSPADWQRVGRSSVATVDGHQYDWEPAADGVVTAEPDNDDDGQEG